MDNKQEEPMFPDHLTADANNWEPAGTVPQHSGLRGVDVQPDRETEIRVANLMVEVHLLREALADIAMWPVPQIDASSPELALYWRSVAREKTDRALAALDA